MKKSLLALAVVAALPAVAQAQTNVTLYGIVDAALEYADNGPDRAFRVSPGVQSGNRFGIRGTEDLGGGLRGVFNLEAGFNVDNGGFTNNGAFNTANNSNALGFGRRAVVGVQAGFGSLLLGRDYTPMFYALAGSDQLGYGFYNNVLSFGVVSIRASNGVFLESASFGGLKVFAAYAAGDENFATTAAGIQRNAGRMAGIGARFQSGAFDIGAAYEDYKGTTITGGTPVTPIGLSDGNRWGIGGKVTLGVFNVNAGYAQRNPDIANSDIKQYWVGAGVKIGTGDLLAQYTRVNAQAATGDQVGYSIAYVYPFSRRTNAYINVGALNNRGATAGTMVDATAGIPAGAAGADPRGVAIGVRHTF